MAFTQTGGIPQFISGDRVVQFHYAKDLRKNPLSLDLPTSQAYMDGEDQFKHIGELGFFGQRTTTAKPFTIDILENRQVMETAHDGTFQYDVPFYANEQCVTKRDTSTDVEAPGIDEGTFKVVLSEEFKPWDVLATNVYYGQQIIVTEDPVLQKGDSFEHIVKLNTNNNKESYEPSNLVEGVTYFKLFNVLGGERDTFLSGVRVPNRPSYLTCEFQVGVGSGAELDVSAVANIGSKIGTNFKQGFIKDLNMDFEQFTRTWGDVAVIMDKAADGSVIAESARLSDVAEWLVKREHLKMIETRAMFARPARISVGSGHVTIAEGLWFQLRRGKKIPYSRKGGITRRHIKEATEYVFQGNEMEPEMRHIKFKAGKYAYENVTGGIYSEEFSDQMGRTSNLTNVFGTDGQLGMSPITATKDAYGNIEMTLKALKVKQVFLAGIGNVEIEYDPSLDYLGNVADRLSAGMHPNGKSHGAYAMVIWDARKQSYSNNKYQPKGVDFVEGAPENSSVYLVKKPGDFIYSGRTNGYYDPYRTSDILSSGNKQRFVDYWSWDAGCAYFLADPSAFVMIELVEEDRRGYN
jgi:hypothetical protein|tara:strand:- start:36565 stop:38298 length:1734 start_codon:yes stop_codon:yes gene_type:complete